MFETDYAHEIHLEQNVLIPSEIQKGLDYTKIQNFRDVGVSLSSFNNSSAILKTNTLFRSAELCGIDASQVQCLENFDITDIIDLRNNDEVIGEKSEETIFNKESNKINYHHISVDTNLASLAYSIISKTADDDVIPELFTGNKNNEGTVYWQNCHIDKSEFLYYGYKSARKMYDRFVSDEQSRLQFGVALKTIIAAKGSVLIHCRSGKDRTGWLVALICFICDVSPNIIMQDYMLSANSGSVAAKFLEDEFKIGDEKMFMPFATVYPQYIRESMRKVLRVAMNNGIIDKSDVSKNTTEATWKRAINHYLKLCGLNDVELGRIRAKFLIL